MPQQSVYAPSGPVTVYEMMIPGTKAGLVIGKNGETIKQLQEENGVKMVLIQASNAPTQEDKPLRITGDPARIEKVKQLVLEIISVCFMLLFNIRLFSVDALVISRKMRKQPAMPFLQKRQVLLLEKVVNQLKKFVESAVLMSKFRRNLLQMIQSKYSTFVVMPRRSRLP